MQRTRVDLPDPERPITTNTSPGATSNETSRTAIVLPVFSRNSGRVRSTNGEPTTLSALAPNTFQRFFTEIIGAPEAIYPSPPSENQPDLLGALLVQMCLISRYSLKPCSPNSRPMPDCLYPPHSAAGLYGPKSLTQIVP